MITTFTYRDTVIEIKPGTIKQKDVFHILVGGREITFVSKESTAKRIAINFIDVVTGEDFKDTYQLWH